MSVYILWFCLAEPPSCHANAGVPMIFVALPTMVVALLPIILAEAVFAMPYLKLPFKMLLRLVARANFFSTFIGIPITWILLVVFQIISGGTGMSNFNVPDSRFLAVTWQAPWMGPYEKQLFWMIPTAHLVLLIPFFFASWWVEYLVIRRSLSSADWRIENGVIRRAVRNVNFLSYCGLAIYILIRLHFRLNNMGT